MRRCGAIASFSIIIMQAPERVNQLRTYTTMLWIKALHIIFLVTWMAGLFYLPRLFVYHADATDEISQKRFKIMERRLYFGITTPGMIFTTFFGVWLITYNPSYYLSSGWFHAKILLVLVLMGYHLVCGWFLLQFQQDKNTHGSKFYRLFNEIPTLLFIGIVILAVVKPF